MHVCGGEAFASALLSECVHLWVLATLVGYCTKVAQFNGDTATKMTTATTIGDENKNDDTIMLPMTAVFVVALVVNNVCWQVFEFRFQLQQWPAEFREAFNKPKNGIKAKLNKY